MAELHPRLRGIEDPATLDANVADLNDRVRTIEEWYPNYIQQVNEAAIAVAGDSAVQAEAAAIRADAAATSVQQIGEQVETDAAVTTEAVQQLLSVLAVWVPPGAVMNLGSPINLLIGD